MFYSTVYIVYVSNSVYRPQGYKETTATSAVPASSHRRCYDSQYRHEFTLTTASRYSGSLDLTVFDRKSILYNIPIPVFFFFFFLIFTVGSKDPRGELLLFLMLLSLLLETKSAAYYKPN